MKQLILILVFIIAICPELFSQNNIDKILNTVVKNNTTLSALRMKMEAEKKGNKTNIYLQNPEIEFNYLWGHPTAIGNRKDISIVQSFDFPTAYSFKNQISDLKNEQSDLEYQNEIIAILLKTRLICIDITYYNALKSELIKRLSLAKENKKSYKFMFDNGETNILEYNKTLLAVHNYLNELESIDIELNSLILELSQLNGGQEIEYIENSYGLVELSSDFEAWYLSAEQNNPILKWLGEEIKINEAKVKLNRAISLPKFQTGYISEDVVGQQFQGVTIGMTIPLWENKNKVKFAKANSIAAESIAHDMKLQFYNQLKILYSKAMRQQISTSDYRENLVLFNNSELLKKALDLGEISLIDYTLELLLYYESVNKLLKLERDLNITLTELNKYN